MLSNGPSRNYLTQKGMHLCLLTRLINNSVGVEVQGYKMYKCK